MKKYIFVEQYAILAYFIKNLDKIGGNIGKYNYKP